MAERFDLAIVGAGAAGLMAAIEAARARPGLSIVLLDGARTLGAKILVAGGGRCNVTHHEVLPTDFAGGSRPAIGKVLREFPVGVTVTFFRDLGVELRREPTGKLFPATDQARTVLEALLRAAREAGVKLLYPRRVTAIRRAGAGFTLTGDWGEVAARRLILAAGGQALPKSGSDGGGYALARALGRDVKRVHEDAAAMIEVGMVEKTEDGKLAVPFDEIRADFVMKSAAPSLMAATASFTVPYPVTTMTTMSG